ncbi:MAG: helix-turn-helix domain-containing protein [Pirellulaceae bacterium]|nr:helix-turn-helix domain-containing protein [Pirellulaceae bacterium]
METKLLYPSDAAAVLCLTPAQIRTLVRKGLLPHVSLPNGEIRFDPRDLESWVVAHKQESREAENASS